MFYKFHVKYFVFLLFLKSTLSSTKRAHEYTSSLSAISFVELGNPILTAIEVMKGGADGKKEENFGGGNLGAYYNFMYPDNSDYPWACVCNTEDLKLWKKKDQPYVRCRNQEDLSLQDIQANCDPRNVTVEQDLWKGFYFL
ncbi:conserved hypothetical protein [Theileria orientalis strain Shintoku]|uniref:Uncharacterized protein n=1 Tax=Theileria orientalis strain Shintoku TaxID=869250 RepID=J4C8L1_THEOR|nr:conserved hypothetical protein [Theileria orientalis strain Shintoku]BAM40978.1 conserved hypothetical protein [Theileria orientalis strain Shintoku]|eukprot:XP_009691279.1 conserved hypothetical protein [Theileria orientalis strain Shintoku]